jgi:hypothetical protein
VHSSGCAAPAVVAAFDVTLTVSMKKTPQDDDNDSLTVEISTNEKTLGVQVKDNPS